MRRRRKRMQESQRQMMRAHLTQTAPSQLLVEAAALPLGPPMGMLQARTSSRATLHTADAWWQQAGRVAVGELHHPSLLPQMAAVSALEAPLPALLPPLPLPPQVDTKRRRQLLLFHPHPHPPLHLFMREWTPSLYLPLQASPSVAVPRPMLSPSEGQLGEEEGEALLQPPLGPPLSPQPMPGAWGPLLQLQLLKPPPHCSTAAKGGLCLPLPLWPPLQTP